MIWVVDASVALRWLVAEEEHPNARAVLQRVIEEPTSFAVPEIFLFEVYAVLLRLHPSPQDAFTEGVLEQIRAGVFRQPMTDALATAAAPFVERGLTGHDACYAGLAQLVGGTWLTFDAKAHNKIDDPDLSLLLSDRLPSSW